MSPADTPIEALAASLVASLVAIRLRDRAESYWRDSRALDGEGYESLAIAYRTIADELRKVADDITKVEA